MQICGQDNSQARREKIGELIGLQLHRDGLADGSLYTTAPGEEGLRGDEVDSGESPKQVIDTQVDVPVVRRRFKEDSPFISEANVTQVDIAKYSRL